jgi:hypothetical protein
VKVLNRRRLVRSALFPALASFSAFASRLSAQSMNITRQNSDDFNFILLGDTPYFALDEFATTKVMQESSPNAAFSIHVGDIKSSFEPCSDELLMRRFKLLDTSPIPLIYLPGDNEWVDCKKSNDPPISPENRLDFIRREVFATQQSLGVKKLLTQYQADYPEHRQWRYNGIQFITLNLPGSNNGIGLLSQASIDARMQAAGKWLEEGVSRALEQNLNGLVVAVHANVGVNSNGFSTLTGKKALAYGEFRKLLIAQYKRWGKPCLLLHGDTHRFANDKPIDELPLLQRVESFGFPFTSSWVRISVVHQNPALFVVSANHL